MSDDGHAPWCYLNPCHCGFWERQAERTVANAEAIHKRAADERRGAPKRPTGDHLRAGTAWWKEDPDRPNIRTAWAALIRRHGSPVWQSDVRFHSSDAARSHAKEMLDLWRGSAESTAPCEDQFCPYRKRSAA